MRKTIQYFAVCLLAICTMGCSEFGELFDEYMDYSKVTIEYDYNWDYRADYKDFKISFDDKTYSAVGTYKVPKGTIISMSWSYAYTADSHYNTKWAKASKEVSAGENMTVVISGSAVRIKTDYDM
ncbi:MAG: hypothetical protein IJ290_00650 [Bacteroidaceae bacterium]|nr:hypothetical protein [Bacteroidaceae bacterium]